MDRNELQSYAADILARTKRLICQWATGTGKSGVVLKFLARNPSYDCLILVPEQNNIENWRDEFRKFNLDCSNVTIMCYASFHKLKNTRWDVLVFDEMPHLDTAKRLAICKSVTGEYILALGAVIDAEEKLSLESVYGKFTTSTITIKEAIEAGILPSPTVYILHLQLDNESRTHRYNGRMCTAKEIYDAVQEKVKSYTDQYNRNASEFNKRRMLSAGNERKKLLGALKEEAIRSICNALQAKGKRFICFCSSIEQANRLGEGNAFTSKTPVSERKLEKFNNHEIDSIYVVGKLIENQNLNDIEVGVIGQLGGTQRITVQEAGRIMRSKNPIIYVPVFDKTKDDSFLYTITNNIPSKYIQHYNYKYKI